MASIHARWNSGPEFRHAHVIEEIPAHQVGHWLQFFGAHRIPRIMQRRGSQMSGIIPTGSLMRNPCSERRSLIGRDHSVHSDGWGRAAAWSHQGDLSGLDPVRSRLSFASSQYASGILFVQRVLAYTPIRERIEDHRSGQPCPSAMFPACTLGMTSLKRRTCGSGR